MTKLTRLRSAAGALSAVIAVAGSVLAVGAATAAPAGAATCNPKTDYNNGTWNNWCGTGYRYVPSNNVVIYTVRDASAPYHRVWFHNSAGNAWCAWGPNDQTVPQAFNGTQMTSITNVLISANTSKC